MATGGSPSKRNGTRPEVWQAIPHTRDAVRLIQSVLENYYRRNLPIHVGTVHHTVDVGDETFRITTTWYNPLGGSREHTTIAQRSSSFETLAGLTSDHCTASWTFWFRLTGRVTPWAYF
jgi:hypothetical protein